MNKPTQEQLAEITRRLQVYYMNLTPDKKSYIKGMSPETGDIILQKDGASVHASISDLESGKFNYDTFTLNPEEEKIEVMEEPIEQLSVEQPQTQNDNLNNKMTLNDVKTLVELNNKDTLDKIVSSFSKNPDGTPDIGGAVVQVTNNSINAAVTSIMENRPFSTELYKYDVTGKPIMKEDVSINKVSMDDAINHSFDNVLIYTDVASMYGITYTDEQKEMARGNYATSVKNTLANLGYNYNESKIETPVSETPIQEPEKVKSMTYAPVDNRKAGFADIFILSIIVLVYAAIIVNLIMKLR